MKDRVYIFTGGLLTEHLLSAYEIEKGMIIGVDRGAEWLMKRGVVPEYFVGDFDSVEADFIESLKKEYPDRLRLSIPEKDETDTELAIRLAIKLKPEKIIIFGAIGTRLDHVIANIHILMQAEKANIPSQIIGASNRIQLLMAGQTKVVEKSDFPYVSLLPFSETVKGLTIKGFKYPLNNSEMRIGVPLGISNELIEAYGTISIEEGILLIIESKD